MCIRDSGNFPPKFVGILHPLNFNYTFFKALLIFCHCRALFSSVLFLKIIVNNVLYCCTVNLSHHNYFLANKNLLFYRCLFVYIIKRTLHGGLKIWILFSHGKLSLDMVCLKNTYWDNLYFTWLYWLQADTVKCSKMQMSGHIPEKMLLAWLKFILTSLVLFFTYFITVFYLQNLLVQSFISKWKLGFICHEGLFHRWNERFSIQVSSAS